MSTAAFFDLDRTLLAGPSGPIMAAALRAEGVLGGSPSVAERVGFGIYRHVGETLPVMLMSRASVRATVGRSRPATIAAAEAAAEPMLAALQPFAADEIASHRAAGRKVVIATTTPDDLVRPFAEALGVDDVIATRYGVVQDRYDGTVDGHYVWNRGKLAAVQEWSAANGVDLSRSYAYSDSVFDAPLLAEAGTAIAVQPDVRLEVLARTLGWEIRHLDAPPGVVKLAGAEVQRLLHWIVPILSPFARFDIRGLENIPADGPAILVANHRSYFDPLAVGLLGARAGRVLRFLGKREVFDAPVVGDIVSAVGGIPVDRGTGSAASLEAATRSLSAGEIIAMMPQGTIPRGPAFFDPKLIGRPGAARLAAASGAPVVPVGLWGTETVWPRSASRPSPRLLGGRPTVSVEVGAPISLSGKSEANDTRKIMREISKLLPDEAREPVDPTPEQLARTYPKGRIPDESA